MYNNANNNPYKLVHAAALPALLITIPASLPGGLHPGGNFVAIPDS